MSRRPPGFDIQNEHEDRILTAGLRVGVLDFLLPCFTALGTGSYMPNDLA